MVRQTKAPSDWLKIHKNKLIFYIIPHHDIVEVGEALHLNFHPPTQTKKTSVRRRCFVVATSRPTVYDSRLYYRLRPPPSTVRRGPPTSRTRTADGAAASRTWMTRTTTKNSTTATTLWECATRAIAISCRPFLRRATWWHIHTSHHEFIAAAHRSLIHYRIVPQCLWRLEQSSPFLWYSTKTNLKKKCRIAAKRK